MVRKTHAPVLPARPRPTRYPLPVVMTEAETLAALREENRILYDRLAAFEKEFSHTPMPIPTPPPIPFKEPTIRQPPTFDGKASEFPSFLQQCKLYIRMKPITFKDHDDESHVAFFLSHLRGVPAECGQALLESNSSLLIDYNLFLGGLIALYQNRER